MFENTFQTVLIGVFIVTALVGVAIFAVGGIGSGGEDDLNVTFSVWGEWDSDTFNNLVAASGVAENDGITINYQRIPSGQLEGRLVNALARGQGPDVLLMPHTNLLQFSDLITNIGSNSYSSRKFRDTFIEGTEIFLSDTGVSALPVAMDPLVMYWNRDILTQAGLLSPPENWQQVSDYAERITERDAAGSIQTAGISFGLPANVGAVKEILSTLFLQVDNSIVDRVGNGYESRLRQNSRSTESALGLYTQFANPSSRVYSWNNSFQSDRQAFTSGNLGLYVAPASDIAEIRRQNPNLNFDVSTVPQLQGGVTRTYATVYGLAILNQASNKSLILEALDRFTGPTMSRALAEQTNYTSVRRDVLRENVADPYQQVFRQSALISRGWFDPDPVATDQLFSEMVSDINSGRLDTRSALQGADSTLSNILNR